MADSKKDQNSPKKQTFQTPKGVHDILPKDHEYYTFIKKVVRHRCRQAGYRRITTPIFEFTDVFARGVGEDTDIVQKEMYTFEDRKGRSLTLKPEGTAGVVRSYIQHNMKEWPQPVELYYIEPFFRYDRPQKGRYRQFWQFGLECIGEGDPALDAQLIQIGHLIFQDLGIDHLLKLQINNIGTPECREKYAAALKDYFIGKERYLSEDSKKRLETNPLRILDSKDEDDQILVEMAPKIDMFLSKDSKAYFEEVKEFLDEMGIEYNVNDKLVRGLDYYSKTVFEFWDAEAGAQSSLGGGGRYDALVEELGGEPTPAVGYAAGMERIVATMKREKIRVPSKDDLHVFVAQLGQEAKKKCLPLILEMREAGIKTMGAMGKGAIKNQLKLADKFGVPYTLILGLTEVRDGTIIIRDMSVGTQEIVPFDEVVDRVIEKLGKKSLDKYTPGEVVH